ncbi:hypothetical protein J6590_053131 [Homalodisca vitripennis]|nr:hypothetical protein J6590_053131 [Homalodisca vitripennis]
MVKVTNKPAAYRLKVRLGRATGVESGRVSNWPNKGLIVQWFSVQCSCRRGAGIGNPLDSLVSGSRNSAVGVLVQCMFLSALGANHSVLGSPADHSISVEELTLCYSPAICHHAVYVSWQFCVINPTGSKTPVPPPPTPRTSWPVDTLTHAQTHVSLRATHLYTITLATYYAWTLALASEVVVSCLDGVGGGGDTVQSRSRVRVLPPLWSRHGSGVGSRHGTIQGLGGEVDGSFCIVDEMLYAPSVDLMNTFSRLRDYGWVAEPARHYFKVW